MTSQKFVLFDFDGVVADSVDVVWQTAQAMHPHFTKDIWLRLFEGNIYHSYESVQCDERCCAGDEEFFAYYSTLQDKIRPFPGAETMVKEMATQYSLAIISSSISMDVMRFLE